MATAPILEDPIPATSAYTPLEVYLNTMYHPDCDYIDGQLKERNLGEKPHAKLQGFFYLYFHQHRSSWRADALPELRVKVAERRYRIADVCVISDEAPDEDVILTPPVLCIEVLSRGDSMSEILDRVDDYLEMGVPAVWIIDPWKRRAHSVTSDGTLKRETEHLTVPGTPISVPIDEIFAELTPRTPNPADSVQSVN